MPRAILYVLSVIVSVAVGVIAYSSLMPATYECDIATVKPIDRLSIEVSLKTRGRFLTDNAALDACLEIKAGESTRAQQIHTLINGAYIKARSYAIINKLFFWMSILLAVCVMGMPIIRALVPEATRWRKVVDTDQLPAIILVAGLSFALYSDYKHKQTSAEDLMAYAYYSSDTDFKVIAERVRKGLLEIDRGHDFSKLLEAQ